MRACICNCTCVCACVRGFFLHVSHPPPLREDKVTIIFVTAGGKCDLLSHSYCFIFFKVFVGKHPSAPRPLSALSLSVAHFLYKKRKKILHPLTSLSDSLSPSFTLPSLQDGHLIHLTSWKDKYSLVECEAPASPLTQTGDEGKVSLSAELRRPNALIKSSTQPDTDIRMAAKSPTPQTGFLLLFRNRFSSVDSMRRVSCMKSHTVCYSISFVVYRTA